MHVGDLIDVLENIDVGIVIIDKNRIVRYLNKRCLDWCLLKKVNVVGNSLDDLINNNTFINIYRLRRIFDPYIKENDNKFIIQNKSIKNYNLILIYNLEILLNSEKTNDISTLYIKKDHNKIIAFSKKMTSIVNFAAKIAQTDATVLITGESGVGKDLLAGFIHYSSNRKDYQFIEINSATIPENLFETELFGYDAGAFSGASSKGKKGLVEESNKGTLFLNEVGDLPIAMQAKLLSVLQKKQLTKVGGIKPIDVDTRIIAATNKDLKKLIEEKKFREDLYYRLDVISINIPPLRERIEDIEPLILYLTNLLNERFGFKKMLMPDLISYFKTLTWKGNVRELENQIEKLFLSTKVNKLTKKDFILNFETATDTDNFNNLKDLSTKLEKETFLKAIAMCKTTRQIARYLGISQPTVVRKLKKYNLKLY